MEFLPRQGPKSEDKNIREVVQWMEAELNRLTLSLTEAGLVPMQELHVAVEKPREGMLARADGSDWNPGSGRGTYEYVGGVWRSMGNAGITTDGDKGDVTVGGSGTTLTIDNDAVTYAKMQNVSATNRFLGRITAGAGDPEELTGTQATTLLDTFTSSLKGLVPASGGGTTNFLRADGSFAVPPAGGITALTPLAATSGTTVSFTSIPSWKVLLFSYGGISHNSGGTATLQFELSTNNGGAYGTATGMFSTALGGAVVGSGMLMLTKTTSGHVFQSTFAAQVLGGLEATTGTVDAVRIGWTAGSFDGASGVFNGYVFN